MKRYIKLFWAGLTGILSAIANWIATVLGMTDDSKFGRFIRRVVGTCFAVLVLIFTGAILWAVGENVWRKLDCDWFKADQIDYYGNEELSREISFHEGYAKDGYLFNRDNKKVLKNISWIAKPLGKDSLVCYSNGEKRGYFNMYTGEVVIKPQYRHAWIFSDGLASVEDNGWIKFIDHTGKVVIDNHIRYVPGKDGYVFHNGYCVVDSGDGDLFGLIDKTGQTILPIEYSSIYPTDDYGLWRITKGKENGLLDKDLKTIIPLTVCSMWVYDEMVHMTMPDHTMRKLTLQGELINDFYITGVRSLEYSKEEVLYRIDKTTDDEGNIVDTTINSYHPVANAKMKAYVAGDGYEGLMSVDGHIMTKPLYKDITAIGYDLYLCDVSNGDHVIVNGKGEIIK